MQRTRVINSVVVSGFFKGFITRVVYSRDVIYNVPGGIHRHTR